MSQSKKNLTGERKNFLIAEFNLIEYNYRNILQKNGTGKNVRAENKEILNGKSSYFW